MNNNSPYHTLITALGVKPRVAHYTLEAKKDSSNFPSCALLKLWPGANRPDRVVVLVTSTAEEKVYPEFRNEVATVSGNIAIQAVLIPDGRSSEEVTEILNRVAGALPESGSLSLDVTGGYRHFPFLFSSIAQFAAAVRGLKVDRVFYGMLEGQGTTDNPAPFVDLRSLLDFTEWMFATRSFSEHGATSHLSKLLTTHATSLRSHTPSGSNPEDHLRECSRIEKLAKGLDVFGFAYESALPVELGKAAASVGSSGTFPAPVPLWNELFRQVVTVADKFRLESSVSKKGHWKNHIKLTPYELDRQAGIIENFLERHQYIQGFGMLREWVVSHELFQSGIEDWLNNDKRSKAEKRLGAIAAASKKSGVENESIREWGSFWNTLTSELRNAYLHQGMRTEEVKTPKKEMLALVLGFWNRIHNEKLRTPDLGGGSGILLICPQGNSPGVLFSAIRKTNPDHCLIICSRDSEGSIGTAMRAAGFSASYDQFVFQDPFSGTGELPEIERQHKEVIRKADRVIVNLTGGTTLMGIAVQQLAQQAKALQRPCESVALIDKRPPDIQRSDPYDDKDVQMITIETSNKL